MLIDLNFEGINLVVDKGVGVQTRRIHTQGNTTDLRKQGRLVGGDGKFALDSSLSLYCCFLVFVSRQRVSYLRSR